MIQETQQEQIKVADRVTELLRGHTSEDNGLIVDNYPYGFRLRTKIKYWIETDKKKGDRFVSMTLNPKTQKWNNPKKSVYKSVMVMTKDERGYINYIGIYPTTDRQAIENFLNKIKGFELSQEQAEQIRILKAYSKTYESVTFSCSVRRFKHKITGEITENLPIFHLSEYYEINEQGEIINQEEEKNKQEEVKKEINKSVAYHYHKNDF